MSMLAVILPLAIGTWQIVVIVALALLLFGGKKIPELMRGMGRGMREFKDAVNTDYSAEDKKNTSTSNTSATNETVKNDEPKIGQ